VLSQEVAELVDTASAAADLGGAAGDTLDEAGRVLLQDVESDAGSAGQDTGAAGDAAVGVGVDGEQDGVLDHGLVGLVGDGDIADVDGGRGHDGAGQGVTGQDGDEGSSGETHLDGLKRWVFGVGDVFEG
jgi:hypothetical protein